MNTIRSLGFSARLIGFALFVALAIGLLAAAATVM